MLSSKEALRREALARRGAMSAPQRAERSRAICRALESLPELSGAKRVLGYWPHGDECDLRPLYDLLRDRGVALAFPVSGEDGSMEAYVPRAALRRGRFGIPEPDPASSLLLAPEALDAVLVPCVGFDAALGRLGHGGGYYDRFLPRCPRAGAILIAFEAQRLPAVPREEHDLSFSVLVTENGVHRT